MTGSISGAGFYTTRKCDSNFNKSIYFLIPGKKKPYPFLAVHVFSGDLYPAFENAFNNSERSITLYIDKSDSVERIIHLGKCLGTIQGRNFKKMTEGEKKSYRNFVFNQLKELKSDLKKEETEVLQQV
jgi:hypothetical protein